MTRHATPSEPQGWIDPTTARVVLGVVSLALAVFVAWDAYRQTGDIEFAARLALMAALSLWLVYRLALWVTRFLRRRGN